jgi:hypothetical protein
MYYWKVSKFISVFVFKGTNRFKPVPIRTDMRKALAILAFASTPFAAAYLNQVALPKLVDEKALGGSQPSFLTKNGRPYAYNGRLGTELVTLTENHAQLGITTADGTKITLQAHPDEYGAMHIVSAHVQDSKGRRGYSTHNSVHHAVIQKFEADYYARVNTIVELQKDRTIEAYRRIWNREK